MNQRLFQDAGGTTPAIIAGQPVGLIKRLAGSVDALQATALSKPTLARWPKVGMRNLGALNVFDSVALGPISGPSFTRSGLTITGAINGINVDCIGKGMDNGVPYVDLHIYGTSTAASTHYVNVAYTAALPVIGGMQYTTSLWLKSLRPVEENINADFRVFQNFNAPTSGSALPRIPTLEWMRYSVTGTPSEGQTVFSSRGGYLRVNQAGDLVDVKIRVGGLQCEIGAVATPLQIVYGTNDITETGVADLWHLYNDGGDSLNVTLPAGTYGLASIDINRAITITTITSDGTTPINTLRHERQLDVMLRAGAFSSGEEIAIRDYWGRVFA